MIRWGLLLFAVGVGVLPLFDWPSPWAIIRGGLDRWAALIALMGLFGLWRDTRRGAFPLLFAAIGFSIVLLRPLDFAAIDVVELFSAGGVVWGLTRVTRTRVARILAVLFSVLAGAWGVSAFSPDGVAAVRDGLQYGAAGVVLGSVLVAMGRRATARAAA